MNSHPELMDFLLCYFTSKQSTSRSPDPQDDQIMLKCHRLYDKRTEEDQMLQHTEPHSLCKCGYLILCRHHPSREINRVILKFLDFVALFMSMGTLCLLFQLYNVKRIRIYTQLYVCAYFSKIIIKIICQLLGRGCDFSPFKSDLCISQV